MSRHEILARHSAEYRSIKEFYGDRCAERSKVPLIQHINDGLVVLEAIDASLFARRAFCLHPMFQADSDLKHTVLSNGPFWSIEAHVLLLAMEYRYRANAWLSDKVGRFSKDPRWITWKGEPTPGDLSEVRDMLIADKVQNCKDFLEHHQETHPRSKELEIYFKKWFFALGVEGDVFQKLCGKIDESRA